MVFFNGIGSSDNMDIRDYSWAFNDGISNYVVPGMETSHQFDIQGLFFVTLTVTDLAGNQGTDTMWVMVYLDTDNDGIADHIDTDDDDDGVLDVDDDSFYFSDNVIKALLSRVYLYMEDWASAAAMAGDVIGSGDYSLVDNADYPSIFSGDHSSETIFEVAMNETDNLGGGCLAANYLSNGYNEYLPTYDLYDAFEDGDIRKETMIVVDSTIGGGDYGYIRVNKFVDVLGYENSPVVRLAELYLTRAEANYHLGATVEAQADATTIRQRGLPSAPAVAATGEALLDEILLERRKELCFEGHRLWDLTRNKRGVYRTDCTAGVCSIDYPNDGFVLAIGLQELEVNDNIIQNKGY